jgi:hypothetical protein
MWLAVGPSAGGLAPLWQVAHWLATGIWLWFQLVGFQPLVVWQLVQLSEVLMWLLVFPVAEVPLWQLAQLVADVIPLWSMPLAGNQPEVLWHVPQGAWVTR